MGNETLENRGGPSPTERSSGLLDRLRLLPTSSGLWQPFLGRKATGAVGDHLSLSQADEYEERWTRGVVADPSPYLCLRFLVLGLDSES